MSDDVPPDAVPAIGDVVALLVELAGRVEVLTDQVSEIERIVWRLERERRDRERENR